MSEHGRGCGGCRELMLIDAARTALSAIYDPNDPRDRAAEAEAMLRHLGIEQTHEASAASAAGHEEDAHD